RVVRRQRPPDLVGLLPHIPFVDLTVAPDDERHDPRRSVDHGVRDERESPGHLTVDDVAALPARCTVSLCRENAEVIAAPRSVGLLPPGGPRRRGDGAERTHVLFPGGRPVETVLLARRAEQLLRVHLWPPPCPAGVVFLGAHVHSTGGDGLELVRADPA